MLPHQLHGSLVLTGQSIVSHHHSQAMAMLKGLCSGAQARNAHPAGLNHSCPPPPTRLRREPQPLPVATPLVAQVPPHSPVLPALGPPAVPKPSVPRSRAAVHRTQLLEPAQLQQGQITGQQAQQSSPQRPRWLLRPSHSSPGPPTPSPQHHQHSLGHPDQPGPRSRPPRGRPELASLSPPQLPAMLPDEPRACRQELTPLTTPLPRTRLVLPGQARQARARTAAAGPRGRAGMAEAAGAQAAAAAPAAPAAAGAPATPLSPRPAVLLGRAAARPARAHSQWNHRMGFRRRAGEGGECEVKRQGRQLSSEILACGRAFCSRGQKEHAVPCSLGCSLVTVADTISTQACAEPPADAQPRLSTV